MKTRKVKGKTTFNETLSKSPTEIQNLFRQKADFLKYRELRKVADQMPYKQVPKKYLKDFTNLWVLRLGHSYRAVFTLISDDNDLYCYFLKLMTHKEYDREFGYHTT